MAQEEAQNILEKKGLARAEAVYRERERVAADLKERGHTLVGYMCYFSPPELMSAVGLTPFRLTGRLGEPITEADAYLEPYGCPYVRNCFDQALKGRTDFLDGLIIPHSCDVVQRVFLMWTYYRPYSYEYMVNVPHQVAPYSQRFFKRELGFFLESLEEFTGRKVSDSALQESIEEYNHNRRQVRQLYELRRQDPPLLTAAEMLYVLVAGMTLPPGEFNSLLEETLAEVQGRPSPVDRGTPRLLLWGSVVDDPALFELVEGAGAQVVVDDVCTGLRCYRKDVPENADPLEALKDHYLVDFFCPRTDRGPYVERFQYLLQTARDYQVQGVLGYTLAFCDCHKLDYPDLRDYLQRNGLPMLLIDDDYTLANEEAIKNRLQAFVEMLGG